MTFANGFVSYHLDDAYPLKPSTLWNASRKGSSFARNLLFLRPMNNDFGLLAFNLIRKCSFIVRCMTIFQRTLFSIFLKRIKK